ncbi:hypothetical protein [Desulfitobacterium sp.]|uniref:hypothetical protein n=1 Tax=Desulfitobacterium sp. TaxID=49981 RepID=UPI002BC16497|nr:hypothetical protein [Desulfitobacterium sp.]HVJ48285.1 hypothetical protein [Desulfitobacterium sp.]
MNYENNDRIKGGILGVIVGDALGLPAVLQSANFKETLLKAVNLGEDADTVGAVTGDAQRMGKGVDQLMRSMHFPFLVFMFEFEYAQVSENYRIFK